MLPSTCHMMVGRSRHELTTVYIDHILHPTMTDAGFVTEVSSSLLCRYLLIRSRSITSTEKVKTPV